jgi:hypothetical protein
LPGGGVMDIFNKLVEGLFKRNTLVALNKREINIYTKKVVELTLEESVGEVIREYLESGDDVDYRLNKIIKTIKDKFDINLAKGY